MDAKALLDEKALEAAGADLEGRTFGQDPRERSGARNIGNRPGPGPTSPTDASRVATKPSNVHLRTPPATHRVDSLVHKAAASKTAGKVSETIGKARNFLATKGERIGAKARSAATRAGMTVRAHPGKSMAAAGAAGGAAGFMAGRHKGKKKEASSRLSLADFIELQATAGEAGMKLASRAYGDQEILARTIQLRESQSVGMKLACGMFKAAAAETATE